ncbi:sigma-54-dependent Fis family transcriptional regulator [Pseudonocardia thermophila]|uniref:sigma-54-dependent Fis family transcriptional regulator n=1 Tax=Pseudonocardia thermophila TaxID=1848 RepID=UPI00248EC0A0|nr:helix-turn-helix domain-containing protein [Pseudonocardia thermophila]
MRRDEHEFRLREERERVLDAEIPDEVPPEVARVALRREILSSWRRCQQIGMTPTSEDVPYRAEFERPNRLLRAALPVIDRLAEQMADGPVSILLADSEAQIIDRRPGGRELEKLLDRALVCPGFVYAEEFTGTNGVGSALEERRPFMVSGAEHFREILQEFTCIGSPVVHPITGAVEGVLDVTCRVGDTHEALKPLVLAAVREIESNILADASKRERMLLERFVRAGRRNTHAVISLNEDVVMANTAASQLLDASDQAMLWDWACTVLSSRDEAVGELRLSRDLVVQARATRVGDRGDTAGVLVEMRTPNRPDARPGPGPRPARSSRPRKSTGLDGLVGRSVAANRLRSDVEVALAVPQPLLVCGEPGTGKLHVATVVHRRRAGRDALTVLDALSAHDDPKGWIARITTSLDRGDTVVLRHLDEVPDEIAPRIEVIVDDAPPGRLIATARARGSATPAARVLDHFPVSITVPPLRYRRDDIVDLAPVLIAAHSTRRPIPRLLPTTLRTLTALDWPGNVRELEAVLASAVVRSMGSDIALEHLPPEYRSGGDRTGGRSLRRAERDIVVQALAECNGNKAAAADRLGVARSTLYRKMRMLGIDEKRLPPVTAPR